MSSASDPISHAIETFAANGGIGHQTGRGPDDRVFAGVVDEVAVFNYDMTAAQVLSLYNAAVAPPSPVTLTVQKVGSDLRLTWPRGTLLEATTVNGPYATNNAVSPYTFAPTGTMKFFKVRVQ